MRGVSERQVTIATKIRKNDQIQGTTCDFRHLVGIHFERHTEIRQLDVTIFGCEDVGTFDVTMQYSLMMSRKVDKYTHVSKDNVGSNATFLRPLAGCPDS